MFNKIIDNLIKELKASPSLENVNFINSFSNISIESPLLSPTVCVGFAGADINSYALNDFLGEGLSGDFFGKSGDFKISFDIFLPNNSSGEECCSIFTKIADTLMFSQSVLSVLSISCSSISFDKILRAFKLNAIASFKLCLSKSEAYEHIENIIVEGEFK